MSFTSLVMATGFLITAGAQAPVPNPTQQQVGPAQGQVPVFRVTVVARTTKAVNYRHRGGATKVDFVGTPLLPRSRGEAKVESKQGYIEIEVEFDNLEPATKFGPEYLTYVLWAITPEGRATNLGEVLLNGTRSKLNVTTELQAFGLVMTAEPYFAVSQPSDVVVMENAIRPDTSGKIDVVDAKYELLKRGHYMFNHNPAAITTRIDDRRNPLELFEARHAVQLAQFAGADRYAADSFQKARNQLQQAEQLHARKAGRKSIIQAARESVQTAEDARLIAIQRQEEMRLAEERRVAADREARAVARAADEADRRRQAEVAAARERANADAARVAAERSRIELEQAAQRAARERAEAEAAKVEAERSRTEAERARIEAERARAAALEQEQSARLEAERARAAVDQANRERDELRTRLQQQLDMILETRESARGLIVNMSDVLFDVDRATLKPGAREKLAKVAGILLAYPGLKMEVEGHTDSTGSDTHNQALSERRAESVRSFLVSQGISTSSIASRGFGESRPVVSNDTAAGRQQNRRVELVVSGEAITSTVTRSQLR